MKSVVLGGGRGYGESILIQINENNYGIIDSFIDTNTGNPAVIDYLDANSISYPQIKFIVLTHYHQDHCTGMSRILELCPDASFFASKSIATPSFQFLIASYASIESKHNFFKEIESIVVILKSTERKIKTLSDKSNPIYDDDKNQITALSPNKAALDFLDEQYLYHAQQMTDSPGIKLPIGKNFNFQSTVIIHDNENCRYLYGSDLEHHNKKPEIGWDYIYDSKRLHERKVKLFKVPHHGSANGCNLNKWDEFLEDNFYLNLTPYSRGSKLPKTEMVDKFNDLTDNAYITTKFTSAKMPHKLKKKLNGLNIRLVKGKKGVVESLSQKDSNGLKVNLLGSAIKLKEF